MIWLALQCTHPEVLTYYSGTPVPFKTDCSSNSYGELSIAGTFKNLTRFRVTQSSFEFEKRVMNGTDIWHMKIDILAAANPKISNDDILTVDLYGNLTLNRVTRVVAIEFEQLCEYAAERLQGANLTSFAYYIFPKDAACAPLDLQEQEATLYYKRFGLTGESEVRSVTHSRYITEFSISIDSAPDSTALEELEHLKLGIWFLNVTVELSRTQAEKDKHNLPAVVQFKHCFEMEDNVNVYYSKKQIVLRPVLQQNCFLSGDLFLEFNATAPEELYLEEPDYFLPFFRFEVSGDVNITEDQINETKLLIKWPDSGANMVQIALNAFEKAVMVELCNMDVNEFMVEKVNFDRAAEMYPKQGSVNLCTPLYGFKVGFPREAIGIDYNLPMVEVHRRPGFDYAGFDVDSEWIRLDRLETLEVSLGQPTTTEFITPGQLYNCLYTSQRIVVRDGHLLLLGREFCDGASTAIEGYVYENYSNYRNVLDDDALETYFGAIFGKIAGTPEPAEVLQSNLSEHYEFSRQIEDQQAENIQEFVYVTEAQRLAQLAQIAEFEANNYVYTDWVRGHWWIFFIAIAATLLLGFAALYGCRYPCLYCLIPDARKQLKFASAEKRKRQNGRKVRVAQKSSLQQQRRVSLQISHQ